MITSLSHSRITVKRKAAVISESQAVASSTAFSVTAEISSTIQVLFSVAVSGDVTFTGTYNSSVQTETVTVSSNIVALSTKLFDTITDISMDSDVVSAGGTFIAKLSGAQGGDANVLSTIVSGWPMRLVRAKPKWSDEIPMGSSELETFYALCDVSLVWEPKTGDLFVNDDTAEEYLVLGNPIYEGIGYGKHWNIRLSRRQGY